MGMAERLGAVAREARRDAGLSLLDIATRARVSESVVSRFEKGDGWRRQTDQIISAYEQECRLQPGELWRRAIGR